MKWTLLVFLTCVFALASAEQSVDEQWEQFKIDHDRHFTPEEDAMRKEIFIGSLKLIKEHNAKFDKGEVSYTLGITSFADRTPEESKKYGGGKLQRKPIVGANN